MNRLEDFLKPTQEALFTRLCRIYKSKAVVSKGEFILVKGEAPIMLLAHLDTVHEKPVTQICKTENGNILMSPQGIGGDDRCGVYALVTAYRTAEKKPWLLFTCNEEIGGVGAEAFVQAHMEGKLPKGLADLKMLVEIDRKGSRDAVYYDCANPEFEDYITGKGFRTEWGSFSDISVVAPELGVAAVNLSSGYYNAHTLHEYINREQLNATVKKVVEIIADAARPEFPKYEYFEQKFDGYYDVYGWGYYGDYGSWRSAAKRKHGGKKKGYDSIVGSTDGVLYAIPSEYADEYEELLELYSARELDQMREEYGDNVIDLLYRTEIGDYPGADSDYDEDDTDAGMASGGNNKWLNYS